MTCSFLLRLRCLAILLLSLPLASLADAPDSQTVIVAGKKSPVVKKLDKTVYDVSDSPRAANGTAQDVLQATPGLSVSADGQIAVKGNTQVTVLVDGKPTAMLSGEERAVALQTMGGADIASVEVITNPSAAMNANGGAIVNIVLKRKRKPGAHARIQASAADHGLWNAGTSGDVTTGKLSVHGSLALRHDGTRKLRASAVDWHDRLNGRAGQTRQTSDLFVRRKVDSAALGADLALSDSDSLSLATNFNRRRSRPWFDTLNVNAGDAGQSIFHRISIGPNEQTDNSASLAYSHHGNGSALKAMLQRRGTTGLIDKSYSDVYIEPARATDVSRGATRSARHLKQATLDWSRTAAHGQWGIGLDLQDQVDAMRNYQAVVDPATGLETPDPATTNGYAVNSSLSAVYLTELIRHGKWEWLLGARAERMALRVRPAEGGVHAAHWQAINPSLHLKYAATGQADLHFSVRRSLQRPDARDLNPHTTYIDAQNLSRGNPGLQPQRLTSWEMGADFDGPRLSRNVGAFYRRSDATVTDARSFADSVLVTSKQNGGRARSTGVTAALDWTPDARFNVGVDGGVVRAMLSTPDLPGLVRQDGVAGYVNAKATYSMEGDQVALDAHVQTSSLTPLGRVGSTSSVNLSWKRQLGKTLGLTVSATDIFDGSRRSYRTDTSTFRQVGVDHFVARRLSVGFVNKFD